MREVTWVHTCAVSEGAVTPGMLELSYGLLLDTIIFFFLRVALETAAASARP